MFVVTVKTVVKPGHEWSHYKKGDAAIIESKQIQFIKKATEFIN